MTASTQPGIRIELAQMALVDGEIAPNLERVLQAIARADVSGGTRLVAFPETTLCGFPTARNIGRLAQPLDGPAVGTVREAARRRGVSVLLGLAEADGGRYYNTSVLVDRTGEVVLRHRKIQLFGSDHGVFTPGDRLQVARWEGVPVGLLVCFDIEFPEPARAHAGLGAELLLVSNGNMDPYGPMHRRAIVARAMENQVCAVLVNRCGDGDFGLHFSGGSCSVDPEGETEFLAGAEAGQFIITAEPGRVAHCRRDYCYVRENRLPLQSMAGDGEAGTLRVPPPHGEEP
jgi:(R)-amidase